MILQIPMIKHRNCTVEHANEVSYLLIQVKNITGRVRGSHHPLQVYSNHKYWRIRRLDERDEKMKKERILESGGYELTDREG